MATLPVPIWMRTPSRDEIASRKRGRDCATSDKRVGGTELSDLSDKRDGLLVPFSSPRQGRSPNSRPGRSPNSRPVGVLVPFSRSPAAVKSPGPSAKMTPAADSSQREVTVDAEPSSPVIAGPGCEDWLALSGAVRERTKNPGLYRRLCKAPPPPRAVVEQVEMDVVRTQTGDNARAVARRAALRNVLLAFARHDPQVGYVRASSPLKPR